MPDPITVKYEATTGNLLIDSTDTSVELNPETTRAIHSLVWKFEGVEGLVSAGWVPGIDFKDPGAEGSEAKEGYLGPFTNLCSTTSAVIACGNKGEQGTYTYQAVLRPPGQVGQQVTSDPATLVNKMPEQPAVIRVRTDATDPENPVLELEPTFVTLWPGQSMLWEIIAPELEDVEWLPRIVFHQGPDEATSSHFGPFTSIDTRSDGILATGYANRPGTYEYAIQLVSATDTDEVLVKSTGDPTVDDEGPPPDDDIDPEG